jgi:hypothetical protein
MTDYIKAWQCIGCGKIEAPQTCIGICQDRRVEFFYASDHEQVLAELEQLSAQRDVLVRALRKLAFTTPRTDDWRGAFRGAQDEARRALALLRTESGATVPDAAARATVPDAAARATAPGAAAHAKVA